MIFCGNPSLNTWENKIGNLTGNGDTQDDLLVRQKSTGMLGYYAGGNMEQWNVLGYGVDMNWTVIA